MEKAIERNRAKWARWRKYEAVLRRIRLRIFDYEDQGKFLKAQRVILRIKKIMEPLWEAQKKVNA